MESAGTGTHTRSKALRVASSVVTLPNIVVKPKISNSGVWNAIKIAIVSSTNYQLKRKSLHLVTEKRKKKKSLHAGLAYIHSPNKFPVSFSPNS